MSQRAEANPIEHHHASINGLRYHFVTCGSGPAVLLCHGFPDTWRLWRYQIPVLAAAGFKVVAPDLRGFGETETPPEPSAYASVDIVSDMVALLKHIGVSKTVIVGHDWGATAAWIAPVLRPDLFQAVVGISVPYGPRPPKPLPDMFRDAGLGDLYMCYFEKGGGCDDEVGADPEGFFRRFLYTLSGAFEGDIIQAMRVAPSGRLSDSLAEPRGPMDWCPEEEIKMLSDRVRERGAKSFLDVYRSGRRSWSLAALCLGRVPDVPALYMSGNKEISNAMPGRPGVAEQMQKLLPKAFPPVRLQGDIGHWCQLEAADQVNRALLDFLKAIDWKSNGA